MDAPARAPCMCYHTCLCRFKKYHLPWLQHKRFSLIAEAPPRVSRRAPPEESILLGQGHEEYYSHGHLSTSYQRTESGVRHRQPPSSHRPSPLLRRAASRLIFPQIGRFTAQEGQNGRPPRPHPASYPSVCDPHARRIAVLGVGLQEGVCAAAPLRRRDYPAPENGRVPSLERRGGTQNSVLSMARVKIC